MNATIRLSLFALFSGSLLLCGSELGSFQTQNSGTAPSTQKATRKPAAKAAPTQQEISDARSKNLVWVNTSTRVFHASSSSLYGATKRGKFMTEDDAKKAGYRAAGEGTAKQRPAGKKATAKPMN